MLALALACCVAGGCAVPDRKVIDQADQSHAGLKPAVINDPELSGYLQAVGDRIVDAAREADRAKVGPKEHFADADRQWMFSKDMKFHFVNSKTLNAFTTGGEHMYIYTELFQQCKDEDELAAVMSHEYAHVYSRHVQKGTQRQYGVIGAALAAGAAGAYVGGKDKAAEYGTAAGGAAMALGSLASTQFTRGDEAQADEYGFYFYSHAGWDPMRFGRFFETLAKKSGDTGGGVAKYLSDHPSLESRVKAADDRAAKVGREAEQWRKPPIADDAKFANLQRLAARRSKELPDDKSLAKTQELLQALPRSCLTPVVAKDQVEAQQRLQRDLEEQDRQQQARKKG